MATLTLGAGYTSISWSVTGLTAAYADHMYAYLYRGSTMIDYQYKDWSAVSYSDEFYGLSEGTTYTVRTYVYESDGTISSSLSKSITTLEDITYVDGDKYVSIDGGTKRYVEYETFQSGALFTPNLHEPDGYSSYTLVSIYYGRTTSTADTDVTYGQMYAPYNDFVLVFNYRSPVRYCDVTINAYDIDTGTYLGVSAEMTLQQGSTFRPYSYTAGSMSYGGVTYHEYGDIHGSTDVTYTVPSSSTATFAWYYEADAQIKVPQGEIVSSSIESDSISLLLRLTASLEKGRWGAVLSLNGTSHDVYGSAESSSRSSGSTLTTTFSNLQPNTTYYVLLYNTDDTTTKYSASIGTVRTLKTPIALFSYTANDSVNIATGKNPSNITAAKWNALGDKISEVSVRVGQGAVSHTTVYQGGRMTANVFNEANEHIGELPGATGSPSNQQRGNRLLASLFIALKNALNAAITYANNYYR